MTSPLLIAHRQPGLRLSRFRDAGRAAVAAAVRRLHAVRPEHVLWVVLIAVFLLYVLVLILEPSAAGKGGR